MATYWRALLSALAFLNGIAADAIVSAQNEPPPPFQLEYVNSAGDGELDAPTSVVVSPDGRFVYASAYKSGSHAVFSRDQKTGTLKVVQTVKEDHLAGSTALRLSQDGKLAAAASFGGRAISLYMRDDETGLLTLVNVVRAGAPANVKLQFPVDVAFSPDSKHVDVVDRNSVSVLRVVSDGDLPALEYVETFTDPELYSCRSIFHDPSGQYLFVASNRSERPVNRMVQFTVAFAC
jgi:6-phosphogluconolactonase (cycloisomerase 2 family)